MPTGMNKQIEHGCLGIPQSNIHLQQRSISCSTVQEGASTLALHRPLTTVVEASVLFIDSGSLTVPSSTVVEANLLTSSPVHHSEGTQRQGQHRIA